MRNFCRHRIFANRLAAAGLSLALFSAVSSPRAAEELRLACEKRTVSPRRVPMEGLDPSAEGEADEEAAMLAMADQSIEMAEESEKVTLGLGENYFYIASGDKTQYYDFEAMQIVEINDAKKRWHSQSLYTFVEYYAFEFVNRLFIRHILTGADPDIAKNNKEMKGEFDLVALETLFGMRLESVPKPYRERFGVLESGSGAKKRLSEEAEGAETRYLLDGELAASLREGEAEMPEKFRDSWRRFLAHSMRLHPRVRDKMLASDKVPASVLCRFESMGANEIEWTVESVAESDEAYAVPSDYAYGGGYDDETDPSFGYFSEKEKELLRLIDALRSDSCETPRLDGEDFERIAKESEKKGQLLNASLAAMEWGLQSPSPGLWQGKMHQRLTSQVREEPLLLRNYTASSASDLISLRADAPSPGSGVIDRTHVLDIFIANHVMMEAAERSRRQGGMVSEEPGDDWREEALEHFLKALRKNPYIGGIFKDAAGLFESFDRHEVMWQCFDAAKKVSPDHPMIVPIHEREAGLRSSHPDFF